MNLRLPTIRRPATGGPVLTGRKVLMMLVAFFGVVIAVNVVMVHAAISTFGGVDTPSSYQAGLVFEAEEAAAREQASRDWNVTATLAPAGDGQTVTIDVLDEAGRAVSGAAVTAKLAHPIDERRDVAVALQETAPGRYSGTAGATAGRWILDLEVAKGGVRLFRSRNRVMVP